MEKGLGPDQEQGYRRDHPMTYDTAEWAIPENEIVCVLQLTVLSTAACVFCS